MFLTDEMSLCRQYCSAIILERQKKGFSSIKYPVITVKINRYFLPEYRSLMAEECNLVGYLTIDPVELLEDVETYDKSKRIIVEIDETRTPWQEKIYQERLEKRLLAQKRKEEDVFK